VQPVQRADQVVRSLEERYPEIRAQRTELISSISNELGAEEGTTSTIHKELSSIYAHARCDQSTYL
jgi:hypothetical protein